MTTVLFYLVVAAVIGLVIFFLAVFVFGRGEQMAPLDPRTSPAELPENDVTSDDVRKIRFALALRGYRMSDVDWTLERLGEQLDQLRRENAALRGETPADAGATFDARTDGAVRDEPFLDPDAEPQPGEREPVTVGAPAHHGDSTRDGDATAPTLTSTPGVVAATAEIGRHEAPDPTPTAFGSTPTAFDSTPGEDR